MNMIDKEGKTQFKSFIHKHWSIFYSILSFKIITISQDINWKALSSKLAIRLPLFSFLQISPFLASLTSLSKFWSHKLSLALLHSFTNCENWILTKWCSLSCGCYRKIDPSLINNYAILLLPQHRRTRSNQRI